MDLRMHYDFGDGNGLVEARLHRNGGGVVSSSSQVEQSVYLDRGCVVFGFAVIKDRVRVVGHCRISGDLLPGNVSTLIEDDVLISGNVVIEGHVLMRDHAQARNNVKLSGAVAVMHHAQVTDRSTVAGQVQLRDHAYVHEDAIIISEEDLIVLNVRDLVGGNLILRSSDDVSNLLGRSSKKRRPYRRLATIASRSRPACDGAAIPRRMSVMPTLEDLRSISMGSLSSSASFVEERVAAVG